VAIGYNTDGRIESRTRPDTAVIEVTDDETEPGVAMIEARSNLSISLDRLAVIFLGLSAVTLLVALGPLIMGLWVIMAIAIVHLIIVGWCFRLAWRGHWAREDMAIGPEELTVERVTAKSRSLTHWPVAWVRVDIVPGRLGEKHVYLSCQGRRQQLGAFLPVPERLELAQLLSDRLRPLSAWSGKRELQVN
jgi:uncharacterized membrane protein